MQVRHSISACDHSQSPFTAPTATDGDVRNRSAAADGTSTLQLPPRTHTTFLSHDWPISIPNHGDTADLLRRKPFFKAEVKSNTLGSPPLLNLMKHIQPDHWFAAHLHVKFAAVYKHDHQSSDGPSSANVLLNMQNGGSALKGGANLDEIDIDGEDDVVSSAKNANPDEIEIGDEDGMNADVANPDEIAIGGDDFDEDLEHHHHGHGSNDHQHESVIPVSNCADNPDEINIADDDDETDGPSASNGTTQLIAVAEALKVDESVDLVEAVRSKEGEEAVQGVIGVPLETQSSNAMDGPGPETTRMRRLSITAEAQEEEIIRVTKFLALDKPGAGRDFLQVSLSSINGPLLLRAHSSPLNEMLTSEHL